MGEPPLGRAPSGRRAAKTLSRSEPADPEHLVSRCEGNGVIIGRPPRCCKPLEHRAKKWTRFFAENDAAEKSHRAKQWTRFFASGDAGHRDESIGGFGSD